MRSFTNRMRCDMVSEYLGAQICLNGHVITSFLDKGEQPRSGYCEECGESTLIVCSDCSSSIRGNADGMYGVMERYVPPKFCYQCGKAYPWTERRLDAARELAMELEGLQASERQELADSIGDIVRDTPRTQVAALRFKRLAGMAAKGAGDILWNLVVDVASETAKKTMGM